MSLSSRSMFASLNICVWQAVATDRAVAIKAEREHEAQNRTIRAVKSLVPSEYLIPIRRIATYGRERHSLLTLPFSQKGVQLLATKLFDEYVLEQKTIRDCFLEEVERFKKLYPAIVDRAPKRLGKAFREADFPTTEMIGNYFSYECRFSRVPDAGNWLLEDINSNDMDDLRDKLEEQNSQMFKEATADLFNRAKETLEKLMQQAQAFKEGQPNGALLRTPTLEAVKEMASLLSAMNITGDPTLNAVAKEMQDKLSTLESTELQASAQKRSEVASIARSILERIGAK